MKRVAVLCLILAGFVLPSATVIFAEDDGYTVSLETRVSTRYVFQDLAADSSNKPGFETDLSISMGPFTFDWWQRADLASGKYGERGEGDEHDFTLTGRWEYPQFTLAASAAYWLLAPLGSGGTDGLFFYVDIEHPFQLGEKVSFSPALRVMEFVGMKDYPNYTQVRVRFPVQIQVPWSEDVTVVVDPSIVGSLTGGTEHDFLFRPTVSVNWDVTDNWWLGSEFKATTHSKSEFDFILGYAWN